MLRCLEHVRAIGARVALDDLGADPTSTAFLAFVQPDLIKLDMALIQGRSSELIGQVATAVMAHAERTGAVILAEGIETEQQHRRALALGAVLGQGYLFGRPLTTIPDARTTTLGSWRGVRAPSTPLLDETTPFRALQERGVGTHIADIALLLEISKHIEAQAGLQSDLVASHRRLRSVFAAPLSAMTILFEANGPSSRSAPTIPALSSPATLATEDPGCSDGSNTQSRTIARW